MNARASLNALLITSLLLPYFPAQAHGTNGEIVYDVSGRPGTDDAHGTSHSGDPGQTGNGTGRRGSDGGDAVSNPNKDGQDAGNIFLTLAYVRPQTGGPSVVEVTGRQVNPGGREKVIRDRHNLTSDLNYRLRAIGGHGGNGGNGGRGQDGGKGADGTDAYHSGYVPFAGTDGKDGGRGGNAGAPTSGGNAGAGGNIDFRVSIRDTGLAMLLQEALVDGNRGGKAGRSLGPGAGGSGGTGGKADAINWQEKVGTEDITSSEDITNSEGEVIGSRDVVVGSRDIYETRSSYAPGGSDGSRGQEGSPSNVLAFDGRNSERGTFRYIVVDDKGNEEVYPAPYSLILQPDFKLTGDLNNNGFFEPGETIHVQNIKVTNNGQAPTPKYQDIELYLSDNSNWIRSKKMKLKLPKVLQPGESYAFTSEKLSFFLAEKPRTQPGVMDSNDSLQPQASVTEVDRQFEAFANGATRGFKVRYPLEITPLQALDALAPGEVARVLFKVRNVSQQTIGKIEGQKYRMAHAQLRRDGGNTDKDHVVIIPTLEGQFLDSTVGHSFPLAGLKPAEEMIVEAYVGVDAGAKPYSSATLMPEFFLESNLKPGEVNRAQYNPFKLTVSQVFKHTPNADILLVSNTTLNNSVREALDATAKVRNLTMDIWDFSLYGFFNLRQSLAEWKHFFDAYRNKTIVIMGNNVQTPAGKARVQNLMSPDDIIEAGRRYGIRFLIIDTSDNTRETVERMISPESIAGDSAGVNHYTSVESFVKELKTEVKKLDEETNGDAAEDIGISEITLKAGGFWGKPNAEKIVKKSVEATLAQSRAIAPEVSLYIDQTINLEKIGKRWSVGKLRIRRSVDLSRTSVMGLNVSSKTLKDPNYIQSAEFQTAFDIGMHLDTKLKLIGSILSGTFVPAQLPPEFKHMQDRTPVEFAQLLLRSVLLEIIDEQMTIRPFQFVSNLDKETLWNKLDVLSRVANFTYGQTDLDPSTEIGQVWLEFIAELKYFSRDSVTRGQNFWSNTLGLIFGKSKNYQVSQVSNELIQRLIKGVFGDEHQKDIEKLIEDRMNALRKENKGVRGEKVAAGLSTTKMSQAIVRNTMLTLEAMGRVRNEETQIKMQAAQTARQARGEEVRVAYANKAAELKVKPEICEEIFKRRQSVNK